MHLRCPADQERQEDRGLRAQVGLRLFVPNYAKTATCSVAAAILAIKTEGSKDLQKVAKCNETMHHAFQVFRTLGVPPVILTFILSSYCKACSSQRKSC